MLTAGVAMGGPKGLKSYTENSIPGDRACGAAARVVDVIETFVSRRCRIQARPKEETTPF